MIGTKMVGESFGIVRHGHITQYATKRFDERPFADITAKELHGLICGMKSADVHKHFIPYEIDGKTYSITAMSTYIPSIAWSIYETYFTLYCQSSFATLAEFSYKFVGNRISEGPVTPQTIESCYTYSIAMIDFLHKDLTEDELKHHIMIARLVGNNDG